MDRQPSFMQRRKPAETKMLPVKTACKSFLFSGSDVTAGIPVPSVIAEGFVRIPLNRDEQTVSD